MVIFNSYVKLPEGNFWLLFALPKQQKISSAAQLAACQVLFPILRSFFALILAIHLLLAVKTR